MNTIINLELDPTLSLISGIFLTILGSILMAAGSTFMKLGLHLEAEKQQRLVTYPCYEPAWWSGFGAYTFGAALHIVALGFAPASVLAPMNSIGLIANAISAASACNFISRLRSISTKTFKNAFQPKTLNVDCLSSWSDPWYLCYLAAGIVSGFAVLTYVTSKERKAMEEQEEMLRNQNTLTELPSNMTEYYACYHGHVTHSRYQSHNYMHTLLCIIFPGKEKINSFARPSTNFSDEQLKEAHAHSNKKARFCARQDKVTSTLSITREIGVAYGFLAGLIGAQCVLELKELVSCGQNSFGKGTLIWSHVELYLIIFFLGLTVWLQIHFLNLGLARSDATLVVPTYYIVWTLFGTLGGFTKFNEIEGYGVGAIVLFTLGFFLTVACIAILAVQEMTVLRRFVDQHVPDMPEELMDLVTQEHLDQQLGKQVTLGMGLFPFSMLGRTVGRRRFRNLYQRIRRTRSTASDTAMDNDNDLSLDPRQVMGAYTLPHNLRFTRLFSQQNTENIFGADRHYVPLTDLSPRPDNRN
ncbi:DUF803 domain-containing protein [Cardiosporidium cionae]|uniref:DUF803 domain-containing protein n=1 Tax=Cardiosporidium cionae TaxID=476202 RepID=A0ABQ7JDV0_9APIC|nr:DUF803 domain-containing protein [Cardiosporidium cionae]|eukprot:KAF8822201.1 DUF803 domain-containing protein [Cardiosporidium cionae]